MAVTKKQYDDAFHEVAEKMAQLYKNSIPLSLIKDHLIDEVLSEWSDDFVNRTLKGIDKMCVKGNGCEPPTPQFIPLIIDKEE